MKKRFAVLLFALATNTLFAQVTISPTSLFIDSQNRFETILIMNNSSTAQEVQLNWVFGYPKADETGELDIIYNDAEVEAKHSAASWIRGFPKSFTLEPGARQTVRVTAKAPRDIADGTYWTRLKTTSSAVSPEVGAAQPGGITAQINFQFNQITSVFYKHGELDSGLELKEIQTNVVDDKDVKILANYNKLGNSPFLGTMNVQVYDVAGEVVKSGDIFVSIYFDGLRRYDLDVSDLPMGSYDVQVTFSSGRADIPDSDIIPAETVTARGSFTKL